MSLPRVTRPVAAARAAPRTGIAAFYASMGFMGALARYADRVALGL